MAAEDRNLIEILDENHPIDINKYISYVHSPQCGAIATFAGTTRDTFDGKTVLELIYEAYVPMAIRCIKSICSSAQSTWDIYSIAAAHRLGAVPVGETSVFVAISAVHRADALDACKFLIDEIKASVPIWKKEVYTNGEVWKENSEFLERRMELGKPKNNQIRVCCGRKVKVEEHGKRGCCGGKVKVNDATADSCGGEEVTEHTQVNVKEHGKRGCCGGKAKVNDATADSCGGEEVTEHTQPFP